MHEVFFVCGIFYFYSSHKSFLGSCTILLLNVHFEKDTVISYYALYIQFHCIHHSQNPVDSMAGKLFVIFTV